MITKKFWCHYIGNDGNTPKRRSIELTDIHELLPNVSNEGAKTPVWYVRDGDEYTLYAQLNDKVAVRVRMLYTISERTLNEYLLKTDEDIDREYEERMAVVYSEENMRFHPMTEEEIAEGKASWRQSYDDRKKCRDARFADIRRYQDYDNYLLDGAWISNATLLAYQEAESGVCPVLEHLRKEALAERERERQERIEEARRRAEEEARRKEEADRKEQERLTQQAVIFKSGEDITGRDVVDLCRRYGIDIHLRTVHNLQQVIANINGKNGTCQYYRQHGKRTPVLDGCFKTARQLYNYLQAH